MTTLYARDVRGQLRYWSIDSDDDEIEIEYGVVGGEPQHQTKYVAENMSGRSLEEQIDLEIKSLINRKKDRGYTESIEDAREGLRTNALGLIRPMLAAGIKALSSVSTTGAVVQYKYDGHRCLIHNIGGDLIAYSRNGKPITTIDHILNGLEIPEGWTLDGELYCHGMSLQTISSMVKREQEANKMLSYQCYDVQIPDNPDYHFTNRWYNLEHKVKGPGKFLLAPYWLYQDEKIKENFDEAKTHGYEGLIVRPDGMPYEDGKRSKGIIKIKSVIDDEFKVVAITPSKDGWAVLECVMNDGKTFSVSAPGTLPERKRIYEQRRHYIGKSVNVEFANLTKGGKPFHPVATEWRAKEDE